MQQKQWCNCNIEGHTMNWYGFSKYTKEYGIKKVIQNGLKRIPTHKHVDNKQMQATKNNERCIDLTHGRGFADNILKHLVICNDWRFPAVDNNWCYPSLSEMEVEDHVEVEHVEDPIHRQLNEWNLIKLKIYLIWLSLVWFNSN